MASTNSTTNLKLSQFAPDDTPKWLQDYNGDMRKIDQFAEETKTAFNHVCNPNLLDNWYLTLPVNQRGKSSYSVSGLPYTVDRWRAGGNTSGTISVVAGGVQLSAGTAIQQYFENVDWGGKTVTFSAMIEGSIYEAAFVWNSDQDYTIIKTFENGLRLAYSRPNKYVQLYNSNSDVPLTIRSVKLELGGTSTLGNSPQPNYGEELSKCQRYQLPISLNQGRACVIGAGSIAFMIPTPVTMRANPTVTGGDLSVRNPQLGTTVSGFTFSVFLSGNNGIGVTAAKTSHGMTDATLYAGDTETYVMLDANL